MGMGVVVWLKNRMIYRRVSSIVDRNVSNCQGIKAGEVEGKAQSTFKGVEGLML